ncbi:MAG: hypothetical protein LN568_04330 [Rickettsia endosymbiont of Pseudomimeciton antennatum]|nr:hypothetical protein [Rickettsia endosymbiont of Pseudomimeciton antennatum]
MCKTRYPLEEQNVERECKLYSQLDQMSKSTGNTSYKFEFIKNYYLNQIIYLNYLKTATEFYEGCKLLAHKGQYYIINDSTELTGNSHDY